MGAPDEIILKLFWILWRIGQTYRDAIVMIVVQGVLDRVVQVICSEVASLEALFDELGLT